MWLAGIQLFFHFFLHVFIALSKTINNKCNVYNTSSISQHTHTHVQTLWGREKYISHHHNDNDNNIQSTLPKSNSHKVSQIIT